MSSMSYWQAERSHDFQADWLRLPKGDAPQTAELLDRSLELTREARSNQSLERRTESSRCVYNSFVAVQLCRYAALRSIL
jgi:hypothetical protein